MVYFKINHERPLEWVNDNDLTTFVMVVAKRESDFGFSTCVYSNHTHKKGMMNKCSALGHSTLNSITAFDVKIEVNVTRLKEGMKLINKKALEAHIEANSHRPLACMNFEQILATADVANPRDQQEETSDCSDCASP